MSELIWCAHGNGHNLDWRGIRVHVTSAAYWCAFDSTHKQIARGQAKNQTLARGDAAEWADKYANYIAGTGEKPKSPLGWSGDGAD